MSELETAIWPWISWFLWLGFGFSAYKIGWYRGRDHPMEIRLSWDKSDDGSTDE